MNRTILFALSLLALPLSTAGRPIVRDGAENAQPQAKKGSSQPQAEKPAATAQAEKGSATPKTEKGSATPQAEKGSMPLGLEDYRAMALRHNKGLQAAQVAVEKAQAEHSAARTNYLPKFSAVGTYMHTGNSIALLSTDQTAALSSLGTNLMAGITPEFMKLAQPFLAQNPNLLPLLQKGIAAGQGAEAGLNAAGQRLASHFDTDTRNVAVVGVMFTQPLYMGGKIRAYDRLTGYATTLAQEKVRQAEQELLYDVDKAYWQWQSLRQKRLLAAEYRDLLQHLNSDVEKMVREGVATKANALAVAVELNKAEITLLRVDDGLTLSQMLLHQLCGLPLNVNQPQGSVIPEAEKPSSTAQSAVENPTAGSVIPEAEKPSATAQPAVENPTAWETAESLVAQALSSRPELKQLALGEKIYAEKAKIDRAAFLPTLALTGGYGMTYPSLFNGYEKKLKGTWGIGLLLKVPLWEWGEGRHKVRAAKADVAMTALKAQEAEEKITLQVTQAHFALTEAQKKAALARHNQTKAEENLRMARVGFDEGVVSTSDLLAAQTAWMAAKTDVVDAQIEVQLAQAAIKKVTAR